MAAEERVRTQLAQLYQEHGARMRAVLARLAGPSKPVDDLLQEVFVITLSKLDQFGELGPPLPWLYGVAAKVAIASRRRDYLRRFLRLEDVPEGVATATPHSIFENAESARQVYSVVDKLEARKRAVFVLYELEGMSGEEIAQALQVPIKTVWSRLGRARTEFARMVRAADTRGRLKGGGEP